MTLTVTGCVNVIKVWLDDGSRAIIQSSVTLDVWPEAIVGRAVVLAIIPVRSGTYHLWGSVADPMGQTSQTGLLRTIVVAP